MNGAIHDGSDAAITPATARSFHDVRHNVENAHAEAPHSIAGCPNGQRPIRFFDRHVKSLDIGILNAQAARFHSFDLDVEPILDFADGRAGQGVGEVHASCWQCP